MQQSVLLKITKLNHSSPEKAQNVSRSKFMCNRDELWAGFNQRWPPFGRQFTFTLNGERQRISPRATKKSMPDNYADLLKRIEEKTKILEEIYMPKQRRSITQAATQTPTHPKPRLHIKTLETPKCTDQVQTRVKSAATPVRRRKKNIRISVDQLGLNVSKCNITSRINKLKARLASSSEYKSSTDTSKQAPQLASGPRKASKVGHQENSTTQRYQPKLSIPLTKWEYSDVSYEF